MNDAAANAYEAAEAAWGFPEPRPQRWTSGRWSLERRGDELADLAFDGALVLRMIRAVVRDRDWNTLPVTVESAEDDDRGLRLGLRFEGFGGSFDGSLEVRSDGGALEVALRLTALVDFQRNRIGLVVLHPPAVAGGDLAVTHPDGTVTHSAFPERIAPHQPAFDIAALAWTSNGITAELTFSGEVFEMEDQRNWTDASFKTYSTPLALPFPVAVAAGERIEQTISLRADRVEEAPTEAGGASLAFRQTGGTVPELGLGASTASGAVPDAAVALPGTAVLVELEVSTGNWRAALSRALEEAAGRPLDVRIVAATADGVETALDALDGVPLVRLGVFSSGSQISERQLWAALRDGAARRGIRAELLGGARSHFTELNRRHQDLPPDLPALSFSVTPQMHAVERAQLVESIGMQRLVVENALRLAAGRPVHVGPVTLRARYNAVATSALAGAGDVTIDGGYGAEHVPGATDPRQRSGAAAAWAVASAAALAVPGVASVTFFETWGPRGVLDEAGVPYPVAEALEWIAELAGRPLLTAVGAPVNVWALAALSDAGPVALVSNLRDTPVTVDVDGVGEIQLPPLTAKRIPLPRSTPPAA